VKMLDFWNSRVAAVARITLLLPAAIGVPLIVHALQPASGDATSLFQAAEEGDSRAIRRLLARGADPSADHFHGYTALMGAAQRGQCDAMETLLQAGVDPDAQTTTGESALGIAAGWGHESAVRLLLRHGASARGHKSPGSPLDPPLACAARSGMVSAEIIELLIQSGADVNEADDEGVTPLAAARNAGLDEHVDVLIRAGAKMENHAHGTPPLRGEGASRTGETAGGSP